jgi:DNA helicase-2/ATP-dependent DNA helicase PcrA
MNEPSTTTRMSREALDVLLRVTLTDEQWTCVSAPLEPFVIVAGAGTGKTTVMAARVVWLVASGLVAEHEVLGLTFTNKAAGELAERVTRLLRRWREVHPVGPDEEPGEPTIATYHAFARRLIDEQGLRAGIEPGSRLLSDAAVAQLAFREVCAAPLEANAALGPTRVAADVMALDANLAEQTISTDEVRAHSREVVDAIAALPRPTQAIRGIAETARRRLELADLVDRVRAARVRAGGLDFADHMRLCVELVRGSEELVEGMRATYRVVLLDEYQDTSIAQRVILSTLFRGCAVTAVGDPLQAIYGWRSASVANIASFGAHFGADGVAPVHVLSVNRRSGVPILEAANRIAADLRDAHPEVAPLRAPEPREATLRVALLPTVEDECAWIAEQVAAEVAAGRAPEQIAVLGRANDALGPIRDAITARGIPACISGTEAITASPYAMTVLATLRALADPSDNTAVVTLLAGPRWRIGPADLEALRWRAEALAGGGRRDRREAGQDAPDGEDADLAARLAGHAAVPDPVERASLLEAAADPGPHVSPAARGRLAAFVAELGRLHRHVGEPLADLVARVVEVTGARVEAALADALAGASAARLGGGLGGGSGPGAGTTAHGDVGLDGLVRLVDGFADADGRSGLGAFLAYLDVAEQLGGGGEQVDQPVVPGAVQLMSMHKAKGLEFEVVVLPHLCDHVFPGGQASERWTTRAHVVPIDLRDDRHVLPRLAGYTTGDLEDFHAQCRAHDRSGDDRLAYVAATRAKDVLIASGHWWGPSQKRTRGASPYLEALRAQAAEAAEQLFLADEPWASEPTGDAPGEAASNPLLDTVHEAAWPPPDPAADDPLRRAAEAVEALLAAGDGGNVGDPWATPVPGAAPDGDPVVAAWDRAILALLARSDPDGARERLVPVPGVLSASAAMDLASDPAGFGERLLRPMPRRRSRHADLGTAFHAWVETRLGIQPLITDDELPGAADAEIASPADLEALKASFERLPYATRTPVGLEVPFAVALGGRVLRGRIDAVFPTGPDAPTGQRWEVVDWKTSAHDEADPLQLAIYRVAWAERMGVPLDAVGAAFAFVRSGTVQRPDDLPDAGGIARILAGEQDGPGSLGEPDAPGEPGTPDAPGESGTLDQPNGPH